MTTEDDTRRHLVEAAFTSPEAYREASAAASEELRARMLEPGSMLLALLRDAPKDTTPLPPLTLTSHTGQRYSVGLAFSHDHLRVALMYKMRPEWQKGSLNGAGGRMEIGESPIGCMVREWAEETTLTSKNADWLLYHFERHPNGNCLYFYATVLTPEQEASLAGRTDEPIRMYEVDHVITPRVGQEELPLVYNINYLVPMALTFIRHPAHRYLEG
jgi:8-oxo-dGTP pyrophosphatase MutT (NUDIX family)